mgnify:CR=1 FL=1
MCLGYLDLGQKLPKPLTPISICCVYGIERVGITIVEALKFHKQP